MKIGSDWLGIGQARAKSFVSSLFPPVCVSCQKGYSRDSGVTDLCPACLASLPWRAPYEALLPVLSNQARYKIAGINNCMDEGFKVIAACTYDGAMPKLIRQFKFHGHLEYARPLAELMARQLAMFPLEKFDAMVSIPLHEERFKERSYNQAYELSKVVADVSGLKELSFALKRTTPTKRQSELDHDGRFLNVEDAFLADPHVLKRHHVVVVDDILTSGATLFYAMQEVLSAGAMSVTGLVLASGRKIEE